MLSRTESGFTMQYKQQCHGDQGPLDETQSAGAPGRLRFVEPVAADTGEMGAPKQPWAASTAKGANNDCPGTEYWLP
jgi:hypothetical protein